VVALDDFLRSFRKFKVLVYLGTQHLDLPPDLRASIFANCSRFFAFAASAADAAFLGKEFGGAEGALVAERLPELKTGQSFVKLRGEPVRLLRVAARDGKPTPHEIAEGRAACLRLGKSRAEIDAEIEQRRRLFLPNAHRDAFPSPGEVMPSDNEELPEGYEDF
jgi:hypothetical protein